tara:strand:+ start:225 stop:992 length:768 start_codon:yes stop_codon:yes gene_type:complete
MITQTKPILSFNHIGRYGRLGNQMFQYAAVFSAAKSLGMKAVANLSQSTLIECFELGGVEDGVSDAQVIYAEKDFSFTDHLKQLPNDRNIDVIGYFQSSKNFSEHECDIRQQFDFKEGVKEKALKNLPEGVLVSLHVRRGDYIQLAETHTNQDDQYYKQAMSLFKDHRPVVFSDDIEWCKKQMNWLDNDPVFVHNNQYEDMCMMANCNAHIIANSSFSWWAAWLGKGVTVAPKQWFGVNGPKDWKDIYCEEWTIL